MQLVSFTAALAHRPRSWHNWRMHCLRAFIFLGLLVLTACGGPTAIFPGGALDGTVNPVPPSFAFASDAGTIQLETSPEEPYSVNIAYTIVTAVATSADLDYNGLDADDVSVTNQDNDAPPGGGSETYDSDDTPLSIPDNNSNGIASNILAGDHLITNLTVNVNISHQRPSDLRVYLIDPAGGPSVQLFNFSGDNNIPDFNGTSSLGLWTLEVYDVKNKKTGTLNSWSITIDY